MKLYHGSAVIIHEPRILTPVRTLDYGAGFYTTTSKEQASDWVRRKIQTTGKGYVNIYNFDEVLAKSMNMLSFDNPPKEDWIDFVHKNRTQQGFSHQFDIVYGPVANDRVYASFALYEDGLLSKHELILELKTYRLVDQLLFHTEKSLACLNYVDSIEVII